MIAFALLILILLGGWVLGIAGFLRAGQAQAELRELRRQLARILAANPSPASSTEPAKPVPPIIPVAPPTPPPPLILPPAPPRGSVPDFQPIEPAPAAPIDLESLLTLRWGIWLGAVSLMFAGIFLVRYAADHGLLGPGARCLLAALLGTSLLPAAEWLRSHDRPIFSGPFHINQAPGALAAGGTAILFGAAYGAGPIYGLLGPSLAFGAMAIASFVGLAASLRFGRLTAAVGVAGAFITPALVATQSPSVPGLFSYLLLSSAASLLVMRQTYWTWLGWISICASAIWVCVAAPTHSPDIWAASLFVPASATLMLALLPQAALLTATSRQLPWVWFAILGAAGLVLESYNPGTSPRAALLLLSPIAVWKAITTPQLDRLPWLAAFLGLLMLLLWALPDFTPSAEFSGIDGLVAALLPGSWAPSSVRPLLTDAMLLAGFHSICGVILERKSSNPVHWTALPAAVPVLALAITYTQIAHFQPATIWAGAALALAAALTILAGRAARDGSTPRAGTYAAGATAALALGFAMVWRDQWLTLAISLLLPCLAAIESRTGLGGLRKVALAVSALVLTRLLFNSSVFSYDFGATMFANTLIAAYAVPAAAFLFAAGGFRRQADDTLVAVLEAGGVTLIAVFLALEIRHFFGHGDLTQPLGFAESALQLAILSVQATTLLHIANRTGRIIYLWAWRIAGSLALLLSSLLIVANPAFTGAQAGKVDLLFAYLLPVCLAVHARNRTSSPQLENYLTLYVILGGFVWITLQLRQIFHPASLSLFSSPVEGAELWVWSGAWLIYGIALMAIGIARAEKMLRLVALSVIALVCAKVFIVDMATLTGLWRVESFLGLGLGLIGLGAVHRRFVVTKPT